MTNEAAGLQSQLLAHLPLQLRGDLLKAYGEVTKNFQERRWEPSELNGGKLCEVVYTIISGHVAGKFPTKSSKPKNMLQACLDLEKAPTTFPRSVRIQIPRLLIGLYEIRNNRNVGHVGGDVDPNHMDATYVLAASKWLMAELVRLFHGVTTEEATAAVDALVERTVQLVWEVGDKRRVLDPTMTMKEKTLVLLYHRTQPVSEGTLRAWVEHTHASNYRRDILQRCHAEKLLEFDQTNEVVEISPRGVDFVEALLAKE